MALSKALEELLATIEDPKDREEQRKLLEKYTVLQERNEGYLRQSDYDRKMNDSKDERKREQESLEAAKARAEKLQKWADENVPKHNKMLEEYSTLTKKNEELEEAVATAATGGGGGGGGEVDEAKLRAKVLEEIGKRGYVSQSEVIRIATEEAKKLAAEERASFFKDTLPMSMEYGMKMNDYSYDYREEFGKKFDRIAFAKFVTEKKMNDLDEAYKLFVGDMRTEKTITTETEKRVKDELSKRNLPGSGAAPAADQMGHLEARRRGPGDGLPADATISQAAMAAAAELRSEGKA
jgi:hypothetical protein